MAKKVVAKVKIQIPAGKANPAPPVGVALGPHGVNIMAFCKEFNARTAKDGDMIIPVEITIYADRSFTFILKISPAAILLKKKLGLKMGKKPGSGAKMPNKEVVATVTMKQLEEVAQQKMPDLNCHTLEAAVQQIMGTAKSMGIKVVA